MTIPVSSLLRQGVPRRAVQQRSSLGSSLPGDKVHTELAITFPNPLLEVEGREMWVKFTTIVCFKSLNCVPFLKFVYGLHPVYRTCRMLEGDTDWEGDDEQRSICRMSSVTLERFLQDSSSRRIFLLSRLFFRPFVASIPLNPAKKYIKRGYGESKIQTRLNCDGRGRNEGEGGGGERSCFYKRFNVICMFLKTQGRNGRL